MIGVKKLQGGAKTSQGGAISFGAMRQIIAPLDQNPVYAPEFLSDRP